MEGPGLPVLTGAHAASTFDPPDHTAARLHRAAPAALAGGQRVRLASAPGSAGRLRGDHAPSFHRQALETPAVRRRLEMDRPSEHGLVFIHVRAYDRARCRLASG